MADRADAHDQRRRRAVRLPSARPEHWRFRWSSSPTWPQSWTTGTPESWTASPRGIGSSPSTTSVSAPPVGPRRRRIEQMASDAVTFIRRPRLRSGRPVRVLDGRHDRPGDRAAAAAARAQDDPRRTGPAGVDGIDKVTRISYLDTARGLLTRRDPKQFLFFTRTPNGRRAAKEFLARLEERRNDRDKADHRARPRPGHGHPPMGQQQPAEPREHPPAGARHERCERQDGAHQEHRRPRPTTPEQRARHLSEYAGHGGVFQFHEDFVKRALEFLSS